MNILITAPELNPAKNVSGISTVVTTIMEYNKQHRYFHYLLGRPDKPLNKIAWIVLLLRQLCAFPFFVKRNNINLIHQNLPFDPKGLLREYIINCWCRLLGVPVVLHVHGGEFLMDGTTNPFFRFLAKSLFRHSRQVIVLSEIEKQALQEKYDYSAAVVLYNSINIRDFNNRDKVLNQDKPILLFLGRIHESKGIPDIIEALRLLYKEKEFKFVLCGSGILTEQVITLFAEILGDDFEFKGVVSGEEKINTIKESDLFLLPSRYGEGLPMALLETMAAGVVPVVTDDASMKFVVQNEINGMRVEKQNPQHLYEQLKKIISNKGLYTKLSLNAANTIVDQYDINNYVIHLNDIYSKANKS